MNDNTKYLLEHCGSIKLLYVEDNEFARKYTVELLKRFFKTIIVAENGIEGLEIYKNQEIDLVLSDVNMPKMSGIEMSSAIKEINNDTPIILLSAHNEDQFIQEAKKIGIDTYLEKPLNLVNLIEVLTSVVKVKDVDK